MLARRRSCNEFATPQRILVSSTRIIRIWWAFYRFEGEFNFWLFLLAWTYLSGTPLNIYIFTSLPDRSYSARDTRYPSAVRIPEQPWIYLPRFSWVWDGWRKATAGSTVVFREESKVDWGRRSAACYLVGFPTCLIVYIGHWRSVLCWKVLFCSEQISAFIATGKGVLWDGEGRKRFLLSYRPFLVPY